MKVSRRKVHWIIPPFDNTIINKKWHQRSRPPSLAGTDSFSTTALSLFKPNCPATCESSNDSVHSCLTHLLYYCVFTWLNAREMIHSSQNPYIFLIGFSLFEARWSAGFTNDREEEHSKNLCCEWSSTTHILWAGPKILMYQFPSQTILLPPVSRFVTISHAL